MSAADRTIDYAHPSTQREPRLAWIDPLVAGAIYAAGVAAIAGWPRSFAGADDRIAVAGPIAAGVVTVGVIVSALARRRAVAMWLTLLIFAAAVLVAAMPTLWPMLDLPGDRRWTPAKFGIVSAAIAILGLYGIVAIGTVRNRGAGVPASLVLLGMAAATGGLALLTGSMRVAEKTWPLAIAVGASVLVGLFLRDRRAIAGVVAFAMAVILAQLASAHLWSELALWQAGCVLVAPLLAAVAMSIPFIARRKPWLRGLIVLVIAATPATIASAIAGAEAYRASQSSGADEYYGY